MKRLLALSALVLYLSCSNKPENDGFDENVPPPVIEECNPISFGETGLAWVNWGALKNKNVPVAGQIKGEGSLEMPTDALVGSKLHMKFDPNSVDSQIELRDSRIKNLFFEMAVYPLVTYEGRVDFIEAGNDLAPAEGESSSLRVVGQLMMAGQVLPLEIHTDLKRENGVLRLVPSARASMIDVKASGGLAANVADLIAAAGVSSMEKMVTLEDGELILERNCQ